jgi:hypothetical protein
MDGCLHPSYFVGSQLNCNLLEFRRREKDSGRAVFAFARCQDSYSLPGTLRMQRFILAQPDPA